VLEQERGALEDVGDSGLDETIKPIMRLQLAIGAALEALPPPPDNGRRD
jgi:hypothetical protein